MLLLKIVNKSFFSSNYIFQNYVKYLFYKIKILELVKKETLFFYLSWMIIFVYTKFYALKKKKKLFYFFFIHLFF